MLGYCANLKEIRYESTSLNRILADKSHRVIVAIVGTVEIGQLHLYSMFHLPWSIFKFNTNKLGTISAFLMISVRWSNQRAHQVISEKLLSKEFHCRTTDLKKILKIVFIEN